MNSTAPVGTRPDAPVDAAAYSGLFTAVTGLRNGRAIAALTGCAVVGVIVAGLLVAMGARLGMLAGVLAAIVWFVAVGTGVNAAGILHMDTARGIASRGLVDAISQGLMCIPKLIVLALAVLLVEIVVFVAIAVLLFICKIPFLGPLLFTVVFPVSVVVAGITVFGLFLGVTLSVPAIWQGATIQRALTQTFAIVRSRLVEAALLLLVVAFLSFAVAAVVFGVLGAGMVPTVGMSASIVGFGGIGAGMGGMTGMASAMAGGGGYAVAGAIGGLVLWAVAMSLVAQVYLLGLCLVYLRLTEGLDLTAAEAMLRGKLDDARRRATELGDKAKAAARAEPPPAADAASRAGIGAVAGVAGAAAASGSGPAASTLPQAWSALAATQTMPSADSPSAATPSAAPAADPFGVSPLSEATAADIDLPIDASAPSTPPMAPTPPTAPEPPAILANCPQCMAPVTPDDVFCGVCGYRLR